MQESRGARTASRAVRQTGRIAVASDFGNAEMTLAKRHCDQASCLCLGLQNLQYLTSTDCLPIQGTPVYFLYNSSTEDVELKNEERLYLGTF